MKFTELNLNSSLLEAIGYMGFEQATPIQQQAIPIILDGKDLIGSAQTGTGKTGAFVLPILHKLAENPTEKSNTLIIVPTRELALQIDQQIQAIAYFTNASSLSIYGGGDPKEWDVQKNALKNGANIIIATPGKLISHLNMGYVKFDSIEHLVLDEADRMLDMGFLDDINKIISHLPKKRQTLLFSATMPNKIRSLAKQILNDPLEISISISKPAEGVLQAVYLAHDEQKNDLLVHLLKDKKDLDYVIIFTSTKKKVSSIVRALRKGGFKTAGVSSDLEQHEREDMLLKFRNKEIKVLVATDVLSRGIDIKDISLVINYDAPSNAEDYVHRVGRTARADTEGVAITLINKDDIPKFQRIEQLIETEIHKMQPPEHLGAGPEWRKPQQRNGGNKKKNWKKRNFSKKKS